jgi:hypothetical protein
MDFVDEIESTERMRSSNAGNPRWRVHFKSGKSYPTEVDGSVGYGINNPELNSGPVRVTIEGSGARWAITYITPEGK